MQHFLYGSLQEFLAHTRLEEQSGDVPHLLHLLADHEAAIRFLREDAKHCSEEYEDESTSSFLIEVIRLHEKMAWMLRSYFEENPEGLSLLVSLHPIGCLGNPEEVAELVICLSSKIASFVTGAYYAVDGGYLGR